MSLLPPPRRRAPDDDARVLPLINVVFLLLVFFMVAGRLEPSPPFEVSPLLSAAGGPEAQGDAPPPLVLIGADGALGFEGERVSRAALLVRIGALAEAPAGVPALRMRADARAETAAVADLMQALRAQGVGAFRLLVEPAAP